MKKLLVKKILENPLGYDWSLQGFGMLRLYLSDEVRMHIWHSAFAVPNVSLIHTHPWDFDSEIICGLIRNFRYKEFEGRTHEVATILCGPGGGMRSEPNRVGLGYEGPELYGPGETYSQLANEIHSSHPEDGTVTIVTRRFSANRDHARVFWPVGTQWVSAEPRKANEAEIIAFTQKALSIL